MAHYARYRVTPFALFMTFIGGEEALRFLMNKGLLNIPTTTFLYLYSFRAVTVGLLLACYWKRYEEIRLRDFLRYSETFLSVGVGIIVFVLWINMPWVLGLSGSPAGYDPTVLSDFFTRHCLIAIRLLSASIVAPIMEELFWRSFLLRYVINPNITRVPVGTFTWTSFLISALLFGLEHHQFYAGIMAGVAYSLLLYRTKSIALCVVSHGITNALLGIFVLQTQQWRFW
ncbi:CAAX prenyl protease-related protein [Geobacter argillaceus]|uniref:CAAX prenyl protease 2/Lysostaphin resistance protein A-like domain-containing protein n=1 Tax=Geobacter argillaceus TaxID=345631 RepID=A0A562VHN1_9BACT|nr:CAAX prenyl protease-related protein [Geobacter argillaceus]TWJ17331.1 hypothetical protein JN12_03107 [Geobacter argillaceus]